MRWITANLGWKILALGIAVLLWLSVASEPELSTFLSVPVEFKNMPSDLDISSDIVETVYLETRGPSGRLRDLSDSGAAVFLDFGAVQQPGLRTFTISQDNVILPRDIQLVRSIPAQLQFRFEKREIRRVPVEVRVSRPPAAGYHVAEMRIQPPAVAIVGPEDSVVRTHSALTDPIDLSGVVSTTQFRVNTFLTERHARFQGSSQVVVRVTVKKNTEPRQ